MIDVTQYIPLFHVAVLALLPMLVTLVAGAIRQDGLPNNVNEVISYGVVVVVAIVQALLDGKVGGSPIADFMIVAGYTQAALHSPLLKNLQFYLQGNIFNVVKPGVREIVPPTLVAPPPVDTTLVAQAAFDLLKRNAPQLAVLVGQELSKQFAPSGPVQAPAYAVPSRPVTLVSPAPGIPNVADLPTTSQPMVRPNSAG